MKIAISSESSVDLDKNLLEKYDIHVIPYEIFAKIIVLGLCINVYNKMTLICAWKLKKISVVFPLIFFLVFLMCCD